MSGLTPSGARTPSPMCRRLKSSSTKKERGVPPGNLCLRPHNRAQSSESHPSFLSQFHPPSGNDQFAVQEEKALQWRVGGDPARAGVVGVGEVEQAQQLQLARRAPVEQTVGPLNALAVSLGLATEPRRQRLRRGILGSIPVIILIFLWELNTYFVWYEPIEIPPIADVWGAIFFMQSDCPGLVAAFQLHRAHTRLRSTCCRVCARCRCVISRLPVPLARRGLDLHTRGLGGRGRVSSVGKSGGRRQGWHKPCRQPTEYDLPREI